MEVEKRFEVWNQLFLKETLVLSLGFPLLSPPPPDCKDFRLIGNYILFNLRLFLSFTAQTIGFVRVPLWNLESPQFHFSFN